VTAVIRNRSLRRDDARLLAELETVLLPPRPRLAGMAWRWRHECLLAATFTVGLVTLVHLVGGRWAVICLSALTGALGPWPPCHRQFLAGVWRLVTPHRLHTGFVQARIQTRKGKVPVVLRTLSTPSGERVLVWCPAGLCAEDLEAAQAILRAACWARDLRVTRDEQYAHLVTVEVIRRDIP
jgi:hypothetical protein